MQEVLRRVDCVFVSVFSKASFSFECSNVCITGLQAPGLYSICLPFFQMSRDHSVPLGTVPRPFLCYRQLPDLLPHMVSASPAHPLLPSPALLLTAPHAAILLHIILPQPPSLRLLLSLFYFILFFSDLRNNSPPSFFLCQFISF